ncbi:Short chain dehydrogenase [Veronia nyctiphanis]|uniref:Short chain dehydrogenase n=1 Tax=Veronia nyctiphanis TaxID=1278244 RepID=A0A4Q0YLG2_9GAMM|nr:SDR family oxidoreductase [Veronia nyctiphanis]RXJ71516.1 Short chain dehydrogenase [Veronia nyctiphanis]
METVLITGASRGIGLELAKKFIDHGYQVIATFRGEPSKSLEALRASNAITLHELEVTDSSSIKKLASALEGQHIDILINNAGVIGAEQQSFEMVETEAWLDTFRVNTIAPLLVSRALLPLMDQATNPRIITISSQMGALNSSSMGMYAYRTSKAAANKFMQVLASELKPKGFTVCPVHPGWVQTDMGGKEADITVQESAKGIISLITTLTLEHTGTFFSWQGEALEW